MAAIVALVRRRDFSSDISSLSLLDYTDGFNLPLEGWIQAVAGGDAEVSEAMTLYVEATSHNDLAAKLKPLDDKILEVGWHADGVERYGVWLRTQLTDEAHARQALVTGMRCEPVVSFYGPLVAPGNFVRGYNLALERTPWWEALVHITAIIPLNCTGGLADYSDPITVSGTIPARIARTSFLGVSGSGPLYEFWMGFRSNRFGDRANLATVWDLGADGTGSNDTTTSIADATAHDGYRAQCTFAGDETELLRIQASLQSATTDYEDQRGSYTVLLRAKVDASTTCHARLKDGFLYTSAIRAQQRVKITSTSWFLYALGTVDIPPSRGILTANFLRQYGFEIYASRTAGSGDLHMDCFILIPRAEGSLHVAGAAVTYSLGDLRPATVTMTADGRTDGWSYQSNLPIATLTVEPDRYALPVGDGSVIIAGQRETEHDLNDGVNLSLSFYRRWRTLRGAE